MVFLIVWPKVHRVLSGEKVVMSNYLEGTSSRSMTRDGSRTNVGMSEMLRESPPKEAKQAKEASKDKANSRIPLQSDDPLPSSIASKIVCSEQLLREATDKFNEGRPLLSEEISLLQEELGLLCNELSRIEFVQSDRQAVVEFVQDDRNEEEDLV